MNSKLRKLVLALMLFLGVPFGLLGCGGDSSSPPFLSESTTPTPSTIPIATIPVPSSTSVPVEDVEAAARRHLEWAMEGDLLSLSREMNAPPYTLSDQRFRQCHSDQVISTDFAFDVLSSHPETGYDGDTVAVFVSVTTASGERQLIMHESLDDADAWRWSPTWKSLQAYQGGTCPQLLDVLLGNESNAKATISYADVTSQCDTSRRCDRLIHPERVLTARGFTLYRCIEGCDSSAFADYVPVTVDEWIVPYGFSTEVETVELSNGGYGLMFEGKPLYMYRNDLPGTKLDNSPYWDVVE